MKKILIALLFFVTLNVFGQSFTPNNFLYDWLRGAKFSGTLYYPVVAEPGDSIVMTVLPDGNVIGVPLRNAGKIYKEGINISFSGPNNDTINATGSGNVGNADSLSGIPGPNYVTRGELSDSVSDKIDSTKAASISSAIVDDSLNDYLKRVGDKGLFLGTLTSGLPLPLSTTRPFHSIWGSGNQVVVERTTGGGAGSDMISLYNSNSVALDSKSGYINFATKRINVAAGTTSEFEVAGRSGWNQTSPYDTAFGALYRWQMRKNGTLETGGTWDLTPDEFRFRQSRGFKIRSSPNLIVTSNEEAIQYNSSSIYGMKYRNGEWVPMADRKRIDFGIFNPDKTGATSVDALLVKAIDVAEVKGYDLYIPTGTYSVSQTFTVPKGMNIHGDSAVFVVSDTVGDVFAALGNNSFEGIHIDGNHRARIGIYSTDNNIRIKNCVFHGFRTNTFPSAGVLLSSNNVEISKSTFYDIRDTSCENAAAGITITGDVTNIKIKGNTIYGIGDPTCDADGIKIQNTVVKTPNSYGNSRSVISENYIIINGKRGIKVQASYVSVINNRIESKLIGTGNNSTYSGISVIYGDSVIVANNDIKLLRSSFGVNVERGKNTVVGGNNIQIDIAGNYTDSWGTAQRGIYTLNTKGLKVIQNQVFSNNEAVRHSGDTSIYVQGNFINKVPTFSGQVSHNINLNFVEDSIYLAATNKSAQWDAGSGGGGGDMLQATYDPQAIAGDAFLLSNHTGTSDDITEGTANLFFTSAEETKLAGIAAGAEVNVQSDWNAVSGDAFILNKPTIPTNNNQLTNGAGYITAANLSIAGTTGDWTVSNSAGTGFVIPLVTGAASGLMLNTDKTKLDGIASGAEVNVNADWNAVSGDAEILNKPTTLSGYGITDAVTIGTTQSITGAKTFTQAVTLETTFPTVNMNSTTGTNFRFTNRSTGNRLSIDNATSSTELINIHSNGNVNIGGTSLPAEKLNVVGNVTWTDGGSVNANTAYNDKINSATYNNGTDLLMLNQQDGGTVTVTIPTDTIGYTKPETDSALISQDWTETTNNYTLTNADAGKLFVNTSATTDTIHIPLGLTFDTISQFIGFEAHRDGSIVLSSGATAINDLNGDLITDIKIRGGAIRRTHGDRYTFLGQKEIVLTASDGSEWNLIVNPDGSLGTTAR